MPLSLFLLIAPGLVMSLKASHQLFHDVHALERTWIALDNASIRLGQNTRALYQGIQKANHIQQRSDQSHHVWHACAHVAPTALKCKPLDKAAESSLAMAQRALDAWVRVRWAALVSAAQAEASKLGGAITVSGPMTPPFDLRRCRVCRGPIGLRLRPVEWVVQVHWSNRRLINRVRLFESEGRAAWQYRVVGASK